jgi:hypothetical protein
MKPTTLSDSAWQNELGSDVAYIDEEWLRGLKFRLPMRMEGPSSELEQFDVTGFSGSGAHSVVFDVTDSKGRNLVIKMTRRSWSFASYIRELQPNFTSDLPYDAARVHRKLEKLIGDPMLDTIVTSFDDLYRCLVDNLHDWPPFDQITWEDEETAFLMSFGVRMPGTMAKLAQLASSSSSRSETSEWATATLDLLQRIELDAAIRPQILSENPLYVWGGAVLSGFGGDDISDSVDKAAEHLARQPDDVETFMLQGWAVSRLLASLVGVERFGSFYEAVREKLSVERKPDAK